MSPEQLPRAGIRVSLQIAIVFVAAIGHAAGVTWPIDQLFPVGQPLWWLQCMTLAVLVGQLNACGNARSALALGWVFATTWLCATFWWLYISMHIYGGLNAIATALAILALAMALSLYYALACAMYWRVRNGSPYLSSALFAALWMMAELARGTWLTGFGWGASGYAHADGPLAGFISWVGIYGVCALAAWLAAAAAHACAGRVAAALVLVSVIGLGALLNLGVNGWSETSGNLSVTLLQGNIPQDEKFHSGSGVPQALTWYDQQIRQSRTDLVVAPETAIPLLPQDLPDGYWAGLTQRFATGAQAALIGIPMGDMAQGYTNSVLGLSPGQTQPWQYDKHHLVPFGEFIPPLFKWFTRMMNIPLGDFNRGAVGQASFTWKGQRLAPNICYEDLFGEELGARFLDPDVAPTVFVNVSNIGWFGDSVAIDQHLQISRVRAMEFARPMLRATNTGATVVIDHTGRVTHSLPRLTRGVLEATVEGRIGTTPFAWWVARFGLWPLWIVALAMVLVAVNARCMGAR